MLSRARRLSPVVGKRTAMSTPSIPMPMICATASYLRSMAKSRRPVSASRDPERGWVLLVPPGLRRLRYCCSSASMVVGRPSMTMVPRCGRPLAPMGRLTRLLNRGSRYFSNRSGGSMMCMSQSTNRSPSFMTPSWNGCPLPPRPSWTPALRGFYSDRGRSAMGACLPLAGEMRSDRGRHPMVVFDRDGNFLRSWGEGVFRRAHGVHMAPDDTLWLTDDGDHTVRHCTLDGKVLLTNGVPGAPKPYMRGEPFHRCTHTALSPQGDLYVSDGYGNARVHKFAPNGTLLRSWGEPGTDPGQFNIAHNICCDADGWVYVADRENHRVQVFDGNGKFEMQCCTMLCPSGRFAVPGRE